MSEQILRSEDNYKMLNCGSGIALAAYAGNTYNYKAMAIYSETDNSLTFYAIREEDNFPEEGSTYNNKAVTYIYTGFENEDWDESISADDVKDILPWYPVLNDVITCKVDSSFSVITPKSIAIWFYKMANCTKIDLTGLNTSETTNMYCTFYGCESLEYLDVSNLDTSNVTSMRSTFYNCSKLKSLNASNFDTSKVTSMRYMFYNCESLEYLDISSFDTSNVTSMEAMFLQCEVLTSLNNINFDTHNVTTMRNMFDECRKLEYVNCDNWDTSNVTDMCCMFFRCNALKELDIYSFDTSKVTTMYGMIDQCYVLEWVRMNPDTFVTDNCTNIAYMFYDGYALDFSKYSLLDIIENWNTSKVTTIRHMFGYCELLTSADFRNWDTSNITTMYGTFYYCTGLTTLYISSWKTSKVTDMTTLFNHCSSLKTIYSDDSNFVTTNVTDSGSMFSYCSSLVGGNGTAYSANNPQDATYAHVDVSSNPGYFTQGGN